MQSVILELMPLVATVSVQIRGLTYNEIFVCVVASRKLRRTMSDQAGKLLKSS